MEKLNECSHIWEEDKDKYILLNDAELGKSIFYINNKNLMFFLVEDDTLLDLIIAKMIENGNKVYNSMAEMQEAIS